jgi:hypothetical protein
LGNGALTAVPRFLFYENALMADANKLFLKPTQNFRVISHVSEQKQRTAMISMRLRVVIGCYSKRSRLG